jgi:hypothetical protein
MGLAQPLMLAYSGMYGYLSPDKRNRQEAAIVGGVMVPLFMATIYKNTEHRIIKGFPEKPPGIGTAFVASLIGIAGYGSVGYLGGKLARQCREDV